MKYKNIFKDVVFVSQLTGVDKKKIRILLSVILANLTVFFDILVILVFANLIDKSNINEAFYVKFIADNLFLLPIIVILRFVFVFVERINIQSLQLKVEESLRTHLMSEVFDKSNYSVADAYFYVNELSRHVSYFYGALASSLNYAFQIAIYSIYLLTTSLDIVLYFLVGSLVLFFPTRFFLKKGREYIHEAYLNEHKTLETIQKVLENIYLIKILDTTTRETNEFKQTLRKYYSSVLNNYKFGAINNITPNFITIFILSILIVFFDFVKFLTLEFIGIMLRLFQTLGNFNNTLNLVFNSHVHLEKLNQLEKNKLKSLNPIFELNQNLEMDISINLDNVSFRYLGSDKYLFKDLNLSIARSAHTIVTGDNGSGKSTLMGIITGILIPETGSIQSFSDKFSYVGATPLIIKGSIRENLLYGNHSLIDDTKILNMIEKYNLFDDEKFSLNDTITNKSLSSGQMQKISFIRALLSDPEILILDESTSNLDYDSKILFNNELKNSSLTIINSTHNISESFYDFHLHIDVKDETRSIRNI